MLRTIRDLFAALVPPPQAADLAGVDHTLQLATAVMLVEVMRADVEIGDAERRAVIDALRDKFALADDEIARLVELAEQTARDASDWFGFTSHINAHFEMPAKLRMIEHMWRVAYADGQLSAHEQHVLWRVADLLHIPHGAYVHAKMRARGDSG
ncbi:MAG: TerB family tellurite resistance protein [Burkholderiales bacterium]|nr:TerB family tellurite resistance protein [Burkholderiales bacterium]